MGSTTTQGRPTARVNAAGRVAFRSGYGVGALIANFRSSIPSPSFPPFTLHWRPRGIQCKTRGRADRYSFLVRLFHPRLHAGLSRRTPTISSDEPKRQSGWTRAPHPKRCTGSLKGLHQAAHTCPFVSLRLCTQMRQSATKMNYGVPCPDRRSRT